MKLAYALSLVAALCAAATLTLWSAGGFHRGWTQDQIPVERFDEFTEIRYTEFVPGFRAGLDFVAVGSLISIGFLGAGAWAYRRAKKRAGNISA